MYFIWSSGQSVSLQHRGSSFWQSGGSCPSSYHKAVCACVLATAIAVVIALALFNQQTLPNNKYALYNKGDALINVRNYRQATTLMASNTTNRILDVLEEKRPKIICIDELDKMPRNFQEKLLNFIESGWVKVDQMRKQYDFKIKGAKVFGACNEITRLSRPLQSRFRRLHLPTYTEEQFLEVSTKVLPKLKIAHIIGKAVWDQRGDIRDVISIGKLVQRKMVLKKLSRYLVR